MNEATNKLRSQKEDREKIKH